ncbi:hypothetical protein EI94DRAFT_238277 [Lactarius quietus]|nr:hypothetical protein EI94DRAFT_238277 [Lactarius quietus]
MCFNTKYGDTVTLNFVNSWFEDHCIPTSSVSMTFGRHWLMVIGAPVSQADAILGTVDAGTTHRANASYQHLPLCREELQSFAQSAIWFLRAVFGHTFPQLCMNKSTTSYTSCIILNVRYTSESATPSHRSPPVTNGTLQLSLVLFLGIIIFDTLTWSRSLDTVIPT